MLPSSTGVLVVGAGPVGLSAAVLLRRFGIPLIVVDRLAERSGHPKARGVRMRAMELFRQWGLEDALRTRELPVESNRFIYCETVGGVEFARSPVMGDVDWATPAGNCRIAQNVLEETIEYHLAAQDVRVHRGVELLHLVQDNDGVVATLRDAAGVEAEVRADYVIAADGVGSRVRKGLGIAMEVLGPPAYATSIYWRADLRVLTGDRPCIAFMATAGEGGFVAVGAADHADRWITIMPSTATRPDRPTVEEAVWAVRAGVGRDDLEPEIISAAVFRVGVGVAQTFQAGRVLLAGDAAHALPYTGGFGINTGVADVHNLIWKLDLVRRGVAPEQLLDSYTAERRAVVLSNAAWSSSNGRRFQNIWAAARDRDTHRLDAELRAQVRHVEPTGQDLGFRYPGGESPTTYRPVAEPGARAPHAWISSGGVRRSVLDLFDRDFSLIVGADGRGWAAAAAAVTAQTGCPIRCYRVGTDDLEPVDGELQKNYQLGPDGAVLVRPDGHVAWRGDGAPDQEGLAAAVDVALAGGHQLTSGHPRR